MLSRNNKQSKQNINCIIYEQVVGMDASYTGGLTVGVTACDPNTITRNELPDDSDQLLDRPEYWVVHKDVVTTAELGDELSFTVSNDGQYNMFFLSVCASVCLVGEIFSLSFLLLRGFV